MVDPGCLGNRVKLDVYARVDGAFVLVPECFLPSHEAERLHGRLRPCGSIEADDAPAVPPWQAVIAALDAQAFAVLTREEGLQLFGTEHPCVRTAQGRRWPAGMPDPPPQAA